MTKLESAPPLDPAWRERFAGIDRLYGVGSIERLAASSVAIAWPRM